ncbi:hypothetical protein ACX93W_14975 [Paenibacillus sp. CAU 1782]
MSEALNEQELVAYIVEQTKAKPEHVRLVLKHEAAYINTAHKSGQKEVDIDFDDLVDYILGRKDVTVSELIVEEILEAEMDYLLDKGLAGYED